jgi:predicted porin
MAEPLVLEQAGNVQKPGILEVGLADISYGYDQTKLTDSAGNTVATLTYTDTVESIFARYAFSPAIETTISIPYSSVSEQLQITGANSTTTTDAGLADSIISGKYSGMWGAWNVAGKLSLSLTTGASSTKLPGTFKQGMDITPLLAATKDLGPCTLNVNLSYDVKGSFTDENSIKEQPGDVLSLGVGAEKMYAGINWGAELIYNSLSSASYGGVTTADSSGTQTDLVLGGRYNSGNWKTKLGVDLSLGDEEYRVFDYRIIAAVTYLINI